MSGNLKWKQCVYDTEFKLEVVQYDDNCKNNKQMVRCFREAASWSARLTKTMLDLAEMPRVNQWGGAHIPCAISP